MHVFVMGGLNMAEFYCKCNYTEPLQFQCIYINITRKVKKKPKKKFAMSALNSLGINDNIYLLCMVENTKKKNKEQELRQAGHYTPVVSKKM